MTAAAVLAGDARWCVVEGDALDVLATLPAAAVNALVTDPPSGIAFMGAEWDRDKGGRVQWVAWLAQVLSLARAATAPGGRALVWALPRTAHWTGCAVEDAGWAIESKLYHLFGTGWPKGKSQLKPAAEEWLLARTGPSTSLNVDACRVGGSASPSIERRASAARAGKGAAGVRPGGIDDRSSLEAYTAEREGERAGRYPPNVLLSHGPGCVREGVRRVQTTTGHKANGGAYHHAGAFSAERGGGLSADGSTCYVDPDGTESVEAWRCEPGCAVATLDAQSGGSASSDRPRFNSARPVTASKGAEAAHVTGGFSDTGTASRFFPQLDADDPAEVFRYVAKPSRAEKNAGCEDLAQNDGASVAPVASGKVMRCAECRRTHPVAYHGACVRCGGTVALDDAANDGSGRDGCATKANAHPTVKPVALMRWLIRLVTKPGDVVLDPFGGSGTTGVAALAEGRRVILVERDPRFAEIIRARLQHAAPTRERLATMATAPVRVEAPDFGPLFGGAQ